MVLVLVKFVHQDCSHGPVSRCRHYLQAVDVDTTNYNQLQTSLEMVVQDRAKFTHKDDDFATNLRFRVYSITIGWNVYGEAVSESLELMNATVFNSQIIMLQARGWKDILVVNFHYYLGSEMSNRSTLQVGQVGLPKLGSETSGDSRRVDDTNEEEQTTSPNPLDVEGGEALTTQNAGEYEGSADEETTAAVNNSATLLSNQAENAFETAMGSENSMPGRQDAHASPHTPANAREISPSKAPRKGKKEVHPGLARRNLLGLGQPGPATRSGTPNVDSGDSGESTTSMYTPSRPPKNK
ncbi:hypothetical protein F5Y12DRAFT_794057 [Xylaria sp. FL1777]|nr:hypothetical protein F5Y12DRAFT_794057 [Xylaria sp. FL1777]